MSKSPPAWAIGPHNDIEPGVEVRPNSDGTIDEVVIATSGPANFHLEQMDDGQYFVALSWKDADGVDRDQKMMLTRKGKGIYPTVYR